ncbi:hypothetical protein [Candidatus Mesenet endosymbiont of Phosphuga atrata]|uniref:hypothetical protein n=1 Tax=Candidatus Mesenet endosymbiont of Phosphuga atrata TaxID=3066221 RepID=UPI0030D5AC86
MMLEICKPDQAIGIGNNVPIFYSSVRVLTSVNNVVLVGLFYGTGFNVDSHFGRKVGFITQDSGFSNRNKRIKAIQNLNLVKINDQQKNDNLLDYVSFDKKEDTQQPEIQSSITEDFDSTEDLNFKQYAKLPMLNTSSSIVANDYQTQVIVDKVASNNRELSLTKKAVYATMIASPFIAVGIYAAVALSVGVTEFNPIIAAGIFIGVAALAVMCFVIAKVCEKGKDPNTNLSTALKNALTLECFRSSETGLPDSMYVN